MRHPTVTASLTFTAKSNGLLAFAGYIEHIAKEMRCFRYSRLHLMNCIRTSVAWFVKLWKRLESFPSGLTRRVLVSRSASERTPRIRAAE